ncbi:hypothetical protein [Sodalis ligni]|uniref:Uncharacterized protein n=1 Tax=Sodalis ligni TaxID=2697027 RepID=A0A4V2Q2V4_9GAMM|nr:hypothetical protein [Sodalis ligni]TCL04258.1 hypothetical protein EZJ58_2371 [Sodalis ligni]
MDNVSKTNNGLKQKFTVTPCIAGLTKTPGMATNAKLAGGLVKVTNDSLAAANIKSDAQRKPRPVALMYGFMGVRDLERADGVDKITVDLLNRALMLAHGNLSSNKILEIQKGIKVRGSAVRQFAQTTQIDDETARYLLRSWSAYLQREYDFISLQSALRKRVAKHTLSNRENFKCLVKKNHAVGPKLDSNELKDIRFLFDKFMILGDTEGFIALQNYKSPNKERIAGIFSSMFFRRSSKLGLKWSKENNISVIFDMDFTPKQAFKKNRNSYQPITFSEYKFYKKNHFENVTERPLLSQELPFYLQCLGGGIPWEYPVRYG